jgi:hypothetical protein
MMNNLPIHMKDIRDRGLLKLEVPTAEGLAYVFLSEHTTNEDCKKIAAILSAWGM